MESKVMLARLPWRLNINNPAGQKLLWKGQKIWWSWNKEPVIVQLSGAHERRMIEEWWRITAKMRFIILEIYDKPREQVSDGTEGR